MQLKIKYLNPNLIPIEQKNGSDWCDIRIAEDVELKQGEYRLLHLGIIIKSPSGYECHIAPRSSTFKTWGVIQVNGIGIVDENYCGPNDEWFMPVYATRDTKINFNDRICQFRIMKKQETLEFLDYDDVNDAIDRQGYGSTGIK